MITFSGRTRLTGSNILTLTPTGSLTNVNEFGRILGKLCEIAHEVIEIAICALRIEKFGDAVKSL